MFPNEPSLYSSGLDTKVGRTVFSTIILVMGGGGESLISPSLCSSRHPQDFVSLIQYNFQVEKLTYCDGR